MLLTTLWLASALLGGAGVAGSDFCVMCYFTNWAQYRVAPGTFTPQNINPTVCTHILFAFAGIQVVDLSVVTVEWNDFTLYSNVMIHKKNNPRLKVLLAVGGASLSSEVFQKAVNSSTNRETFARNAVTFLRRYQFDGLDIDWEFPGENYKTQFTAFLAAIRFAFDAEAKTSGQPRLLLTAAVSAYKMEMERSYEVDKIQAYLDYISIMSYDFHGHSWSTALGHNSPLYVSQADRDNESARLLSQNASVAYWIAAGAPREKLVMGLATYARSFLMAASDLNLPGSPFSTGMGGRPGPITRNEGIMAYYEVCQLLKSGFTSVWMDDSQVPYTYGLRNGFWEWIGYDDVRSMTSKSNYIVNNGLGGAMFWNLDHDDFATNLCGQGSYPLINAVSKILTTAIRTPFSSSSSSSTSSFTTKISPTTPSLTSLSISVTKTLSSNTTTATTTSPTTTTTATTTSPTTTTTATSTIPTTTTTATSTIPTTTTTATSTTPITITSATTTNPPTTSTSAKLTLTTTPLKPTTSTANKMMTTTTQRRRPRTKV